MNHGLSQKVLESLSSVFKTYPEIKSVWLYGSRANGQFKPTSDIDLAIHFKTQPTPFAKVSWDLEQLGLLHKIDVLDYQEISNQKLRENIDKNHLVLFS